MIEMRRNWGLFKEKLQLLKCYMGEHINREGKPLFSSRNISQPKKNQVYLSSSVIGKVASCSTDPGFDLRLGQAIFA